MTIQYQKNVVSLSELEQSCQNNAVIVYLMCINDLSFRIVTSIPSRYPGIFSPELPVRQVKGQFGGSRSQLVDIRSRANQSGNIFHAKPVTVYTPVHRSVHQ